MNTPQALGSFQDALSLALLAPDAPPDPAIEALVRQPGFAVYRNTVVKGCIDALQANYPAVARLVGEEWFRAAAAVFVRAHPPSLPTLLYYGQGFDDFLAHFEPAAELPYLPGVARLDRFWTEAHASGDRSPLDAADIASLSMEALGNAVLHPHPAARWAWFDTQPIYTVWSRNREQLAIGEIDWHGEGALLTRPRDAVQWTALDAGGCAFLDACAAGQTLGAAAGAALAVRNDADLAQIMTVLLGAGAFAGLSSIGAAAHFSGSGA